MKKTDYYILFVYLLRFHKPRNQVYLTAFPSKSAKILINNGRLVTNEITYIIVRSRENKIEL